MGRAIQIHLGRHHPIAGVVAQKALADMLDCSRRRHCGEHSGPVEDGYRRHWNGHDSGGGLRVRLAQQTVSSLHRILIGSAIAACIAVCAPGAQALGLRPTPRARATPAFIPVVALGNGGTISYAGGPVLRHVDPYLIFWDPGVQLPATSEALLERYLSDLAGRGGQARGTFGVIRQYYDRAGYAAAELTFDPGRQALTDADAYPAPEPAGCPAATGYAYCVTGGQIQTEIQNLVASRGLPSGLGANAPVYVVITPSNVDVCVNAQACTNPQSPAPFCAYHGHYVRPGGRVVYAVIPFAALATSPKACQDDASTVLQEPNGDVADVAISSLDHELAESITDPLGNGWLNDTTGEEVADQCEATGPVNETSITGGPTNPGAFRPILGGSLAAGTLFDQLIGGHRYYLQTIWSQGNRACEARPVDARLRVRFTHSALRSSRQRIRFDPARSKVAAGVASATWAFGDGHTAFRAGRLHDIWHTYDRPGRYRAILTLVDSGGNLASVSHYVVVSASVVASRAHGRRAPGGPIRSEPS